MISVVVKTTGTPIVGSVYIGSTHTAIQNAVNYVLTQGGGKVFIEKGVYIITTPISLDSNIEICGEGRHTVLRSAVGNTGNNAVLSVIGTAGAEKENIYIHDLLIGNDLVTKVGRHGIYVQRAGLAQTTGLITGTASRYDSTTVGDTKINKIGVRIENCVVQNNNYFGIYLNNSSNNTVTGNTVQNNMAAIYLLASSNNNTVTGNTIQNNSSYGIHITDSSSNNTVTGNTIQNNNNYAIYLATSSNNTVTSNTVQNNSSVAIYLSNSSNNTVTSNTVQNNSNYGIHLNSSSNNTVTGNTVQNNNGIGIYLNGSSNNNTVTGNTVQNNMAGIYLNTSSNNNTVTGNTVQNNSDVGIYLYNPSNNNTVTGNGYNSINNSGTGNLISPNIQR